MYHSTQVSCWLCVHLYCIVSCDGARSSDWTSPVHLCSALPDQPGPGLQHLQENSKGRPPHELHIQQWDITSPFSPSSTSPSTSPSPSPSPPPSPPLPQVPWYILAMMSLLAYRVHSIFVLRMFNDPVAMVILYASVNAMLYNKWTLACTLYRWGVT